MAQGSGETGPHGLEIVSRETWQSPVNQLIALALVVFAGVASIWLLTTRTMDVSRGIRLAITIGSDLIAAWLCLYMLFRPRQTLTDHQWRTPPPTRPEAYAACGLGPLQDDADPQQLYLDQVKRAVANILYEDPPFWFYDYLKQPLLAGGFNLSRRVSGEDSPTAAHTMIGIRRLNHLQFCIEDVLRRGVPGDLIETGSYRGGATIFMRAVLKAHRVHDRRVFVCDTFVPPWPPQPPVLIMPLIQALASLPSRLWQRQYFMFLQRLPKAYQAFPDVAAPSDDLVRFLLWNLQNPIGFNHVDHTSLDAVRSNFARYGLLDDQVVFLQGFFADTLPRAPLENLAIARLDGDTFESTRDAIVNLYPRLMPGGYLIVDDYRSFDDCRRAVDQYRDEHHIGDELQPIDNLAIFWQKS